MKKQNKMLRLKDTEEEALRKKSIEINKKLLGLGLEPLKDSEIIHEVLRKGISQLEVDNNGNLYIEIE